MMDNTSTLHQRLFCRAARVYTVKRESTRSESHCKNKLRQQPRTLQACSSSQDSNKLVIIGSQYQNVYNGLDTVRCKSPDLPVRSEVRTFISVYDISDKVHPILARNFTLTGSYFNSRMIGDYVYAVVSQSAYITEDVVPLPTVYTSTGAEEIPATKIFYADTANYTRTENKLFHVHVILWLKPQRHITRPE